MHNLTVPFGNSNANRSVQNRTEWNGTEWSCLHYTMEQFWNGRKLFLASGNGVLAVWIFAENVVQLVCYIAKRVTFVSSRKKYELSKQKNLYA